MRCGGLGERLPRRQREAIAQRIDAALAKATEEAAISNYAQGAALLSAGLSKERRAGRLFRLLSDPLATGGTGTVLKQLQSIVGRPLVGRVTGMLAILYDDSDDDAGDGEGIAYRWLAAEQAAGRMRSVSLQAMGTEMRSGAVRRLALLDAAPKGETARRKSP